MTIVHIRDISPARVRSEAQVVKSANRVLDILELLIEEPRGLTISQISSKLRMPRSSTHGLVHTLLRRGYLSTMQDRGGRGLRLGARLIHLGLNVMEDLDLRSIARDSLEDLVARTHETAFLAVPDDGDLVLIDKVVSRYRDVRADSRLGARRPLHCTSLGKALLAALDNASALKVVDKVGMPSATPFSMNNKRLLLKDLEKTRRCGYSIDLQEAVVGVCCAGAPVRDHSGCLIAAISISTIREYFRSTKIGPAVLDAAVAISRAMGWSGDASSLYDYVPGTAETVFKTSGTSRSAQSSRLG